MKLFPLLFGLSLAANAALIVSRSPGLGTGSAARGDTKAVSTNGAAPRMEGAARSLGLSSGEGSIGAIAEAFNKGDAESLRDELRAAGVDEELISLIVRARIRKQFEARMMALQPRPDKNAAWWKNDEDGYGGGGTRAQRDAMKALRAEIRAESERVLGKDPASFGLKNPWMERQYGFVAPEKWEALQQLEQDYNELSHDLRRDTKGFQMPEDADNARFLQDEKRRDLAEFLSPEELVAYERRQSRTAQNMRWQMTQMDATEDEYLAIFEIRKDFDERYGEYDGFGNRIRKQKDDPEVAKMRSEAEVSMKAEIKAALGTDRYQAYVRANDRDYQQLQSATKRFNLPADTPAKIYALREEVPQLALGIADDLNLTPAQKKEAITKLVEQTQDRVKNSLGPDVAQVYLDNGGMKWLQQMERGTIVTYNEDGGQTQRRFDQPVTKSK